MENETIGVWVVLGETNKERRLPGSFQEGTNGHSPEKKFLNLIEKLDFKVIAAGTAVNVATMRKSARIVSNLKFKTLQEELSFFS